MFRRGIAGLQGPNLLIFFFSYSKTLYMYTYKLILLLFPNLLFFALY